MKPRVILFLVASDSGFRLIRGIGSDMQLLSEGKAADYPDVDYEFSAGQGRNRAGTAGFGVTDGASEADHERPRLARHLTAALAGEWAKGGFDAMVMTAGPKLLGHLRDALPKALVGKVASLPKDLGKVPLHDLPGHFAALPGP